MFSWLDFFWLTLCNFAFWALVALAFLLCGNLYAPTEVVPYWWAFCEFACIVFACEW